MIRLIKNIVTRISKKKKNTFSSRNFKFASNVKCFTRCELSTVFFLIFRLNVYIIPFVVIIIIQYFVYIYRDLKKKILFFRYVFGLWDHFKNLYHRKTNFQRQLIIINILKHFYCTLRFGYATKTVRFLLSSRFIKYSLKHFQSINLNAYITDVRTQYYVH